MDYLDQLSNDNFKILSWVPPQHDFKLIKSNLKSSYCNTPDNNYKLTFLFIKNTNMI